MQWFRMYAEFALDAVVQSLSFDDQRHYVMLLCLKCNGTLDRPVAPEVRDSIILRALGIHGTVAAEAKQRLAAVRLIDDAWQPLAWEKRQRQSDGDSTAAARQRRHRANVTHKSRVTSRVTNRDCHGDVTRPDKSFSSCSLGSLSQAQTSQATAESKALASSAENLRSPLVVVSIPLNDGTEFQISEVQAREFSGLYPAVDVPQELRAMRGWCVSNPTHRKTKNGVLRFVNRWLAKRQNEAPTTHHAGLPGAVSFIQQAENAMRAKYANRNPAQ